jgi:transposase InsO family protein
MKHRAPSARDRDDAIVADAMLATVGTAEGMYGRRKMTSHLRRHGLDVSARQVDRLMRDLGLNGRIRGRGIRTTVPDKNAIRAPDLLDRDFTAPAPNQRWVADI